MTKERNTHVYIRSPEDNDIDDINQDNNDEEDNQPPSPPSTSPPSEASDSGIDTLPKRTSSTFSPSPTASASSDSISASAGAAAVLASLANRNGRKVSIEDPTPQEEEEEDVDTSTWVSRNRRNRRRPIGSDSHDRVPGSFSEEIKPTPSSNSASRKSSQDVVVEINPVGEGGDSFRPSGEDFPRPPHRARRSREGNFFLPTEPTPAIRRFSRESSHDLYCSPESDRPSPRSRRLSSSADDEDINGGDFVLDISPRARKTSGGILKNSPERESVELQDLNQSSTRYRKYSRELLAAGTPVETIQEDSSEADPHSQSTVPSLYRNRKTSKEQLQPGGGISSEDPNADEIIEGPGLTLSDEEFQENYLGNIPANKRKYGVFPPQYRSTLSAPSTLGIHPSPAARLVFRSLVQFS